MAQQQHKDWKLQSFINSLVNELDKARDTLAYKGLNQPLSYDVKNLSLDLQLFPHYDGREVRFRNARSGDVGASKISLQLGSISDRQIRETTRPPITKDDLTLDEVEEIEPEVKDSLEKVGIRSVRDLEQLENRNVPVEEVVRQVANTDSNYNDLASRLKKLRGDFSHQQQLSAQMELRKQQPPIIKKAAIERQGEDAMLVLQGSNLALQSDFTPVIKINGRQQKILHADDTSLKIQCPMSEFHSEGVSFEAMLDPHAIVQSTIKV